MSQPWACGRRFLALGLLALLQSGPLSAQGWRADARPVSGHPAPASRGPSLAVVHDGRGGVTVMGEQASVRELLRVLYKWFDLPPVSLESIPDVSRTFRIEQVPAGTVVKYLLASVGRENVVVPVRPGRRAPTRPATSLMVVHDGHGSVSVTGVQASVREVLALLSKWFDFPIVNPDTIPDVRRSMQFDRVPAAQLVDRLLRTVSVNYVILTDSQTSLPSKVLAAPLSASSASPAVSPVRRGGTAAAGLPAYPVTPPSPANPADDPNHPMYQANAPPPPIQPPMDGMPALPIDPAMLPMDPMFPAVPQPQGPPAAAPAPGAARPGMVVPATTPPGRKPPGSPGG